MRFSRRTSSFSGDRVFSKLIWKYIKIFYLVSLKLSTTCSDCWKYWHLFRFCCLLAFKASQVLGHTFFHDRSPAVLTVHSLITGVSPFLEFLDAHEQSMNLSFVSFQLSGSFTRLLAICKWTNISTMSILWSLPDIIRLY